VVPHLARCHRKDDGLLFATQSKQSVRTRGTQLYNTEDKSNNDTKNTTDPKNIARIKCH